MAQVFDIGSVANFDLSMHKKNLDAVEQHLNMHYDKLEAY